MLTSEQSIVEYRAGRVVPDRLTQNTHRHYVEYAETMLAVYREGIGLQRRSLHRQVQEIFADEPDCPVRRIEAFCKLLDDASVFQTDPSGRAAKLRIEVFSRAARLHPLVQEPDQLFEHDEGKAKNQLAGELGTPWNNIEQSLYIDVMAYQQLEQFTGYPDAAAFLSRYNVAQLQACLYRAESITVTATQDLKTIIRYAKLAKLLHDIVRGEGVPPLHNVARPSWPCSSDAEMSAPCQHSLGSRDASRARIQGRDALATATYRITFSGPASVLRETRRYGVSFARFLPALLACKGWSLEAVLQTPWKTPVKLVISDADRFTSHLPPPEEFDSALEESFAKKFGPSRDGWQLIREGDILHEHQKTFIPDFTFRHEDGTQVFLEIVGFWTPEYLAHRRETLQQFRRYRILLAVPESSIREGATITDNVLVYKTTLKLPPLLAALEAARPNH
jgi:predicted nuclease of restriction endonuclease-like RecB superfamily